MNERNIKKWLVAFGIIQSVTTGLVGATAWLYAQGKASADIVHRNELDVMKTDIRVIREDVAYIRGRLDNKQ